MKNKFITIIFLTIIFGLSIITIITKDIDISKFERRKLAQFPIKIDEDITENLDDYFLDQFAFRNQFISLNSNINRNVLAKIDDKEVYIIGDNIYEINYPLNIKNCIDFCKKVNYISETLFDNKNSYFAVIPDKSYFLDGKKYLKMDYSVIYNVLQNNLTAKHIDIRNMLSIDDYYLTDIHWKQENIYDVAVKIMEDVGNNCVEQEYNIKSFDGFYGASYSKGNTNIKADKLQYLYNKELEETDVNHMEFGKKNIYDEQKIYGVDAYDVFLSGPSSYIEIKNSAAQSDKTLIVFRDSFGSSIVPLFVPYYKEIIAVDLRYISFDLLKDKIEDKEYDVLHIYSTLIINGSNILKVNVK